MSKISTVKIKRDDGFIIINEKDFDPEIHERFDVRVRAAELLAAQKEADEKAAAELLAAQKEAAEAVDVDDLEDTTFPDLRDIATSIGADGDRSIAGIIVNIEDRIEELSDDS